MSKPESQSKIGCIEFLRGLAILFVVVEHINYDLVSGSSALWQFFYRHYNGGVGVDLFLAISGFVIGRSLLPQLSASDSSRGFFNLVLAFWLRRAWRLLPSAWLWLFIILFLSAVFNSSKVFIDFETNVYATIAGMLNIANFRFMDAFGNYDYGASFVYWSLSLEEQFYLLLPLMVFIFRAKLVYVISVIVIWQLLSERSLWMLMIRCDAIFLGVLLAIWSKTKQYELLEPGILRNKFMAWLIVFPVLLLLPFLASDMLPFRPYHYSAVAITSIFLVWVASYGNSYILPGTGLNTVMRYIGGRSYTIYLIHIPLFYSLRELEFRLGIEFPFYLKISVAVCLILLVAEINYRLIERPLRNTGRSISQRFIERRSTSSMELKKAV